MGSCSLGCGEDWNYSALGGRGNAQKGRDWCGAAWREAGYLVSWSGGQHAGWSFIQKSRQGNSLQWEENLIFPPAWNRDRSKKKKTFWAIFKNHFLKQSLSPFLWVADVTLEMIESWAFYKRARARKMSEHLAHPSACEHASVGRWTNGPVFCCGFGTLPDVLIVGPAGGSDLVDLKTSEPILLALPSNEGPRVVYPPSQCTWSTSLPFYIYCLHLFQGLISSFKRPHYEPPTESLWPLRPSYVLAPDLSS